MPANTNICVFESRPRWVPELKRQFLNEDVSVRGYSRIQDLMHNQFHQECSLVLLVLSDNANAILNLLKSLQDQLGLTYLFITHDLSVVEYLADRVAVMYLGQIVEENETTELFAHPRHPYTRALMASAPHLDQEERTVTALEGDVPSPMAPPAGCRFHTRCPQRFDRCDQAPVEMFDVPGGQCRCLLFDPARPGHGG